MTYPKCSRSTTFPIAPPTIIPKAMRTRRERAAASRKLNQNSTSTTIAMPMRSTALLPKSPNAPWKFRSYVHLSKWGMTMRLSPGMNDERIRCLVYWSAQRTTIATIATTSVLTRLELWRRNKLIEPSCDVEECIVDQHQPDGDHNDA